MFKAVLILIFSLCINGYCNTADILLRNILSRYSNSSYNPETYNTSSYSPVKKFIIVSPSMAPTINKGSMVWVDNKFPFYNLQIGDIIVYRGNKLTEGTYNVVHRVIEKRSNYVICKGDRNLSPDNIYITPYNYLGKVSVIEHHASL